MLKKQINIAIVGLGTVGKAVLRLIMAQQSNILNRSGIDITIKHLCVRTSPQNMDASIQPLLRDSYEEVLKDPNLDCIVELVGGIDTAFHIIKTAIEQGKHVVTANKALLALRGEELFSLARKNNVCIGFEASCAGGIPIVRSLIDGLLANSIRGIFAILNGTCNYILTQMATQRSSYKHALLRAQKDGVAESDPSLDTSGMDAAHKIAILSSLAFGLKVDFSSIFIKGLENIELVDIQNGEKLGYVLKLVSAAYEVDTGITLWVRPVFLTQTHALSWVHDTFNAISVYGDINGHTLYYGRGAGGNPTASAVVSDIISIAIGTLSAFFQHTRNWQDLNTRIDQIHVRKTAHRFYLRLSVFDTPGVLTRITYILSKQDISIASVLQKEKSEHSFTRSTNIIITTHHTKEESLVQAIKEIDQEDFIQRKTISLAILDEFPEFPPH
ncbi:hypothetical protein LSH36_1091g00215 [Paralvinella palmiformis]|uniref:Homoserine dehydrogenase n=1 Tax=Paralvinella palmiformis TaxID=53620 RepID=A0AAD9MRK0_9ANNE|nr:hypothetical protein LSH36_1091g00215 [Paralvinella palmiformis]